jgi:hypothetical protein
LGKRNGQTGAVPPDPATLDMIEPALKDTIKMVCPYKALEKAETLHASQDV